MTLKDRVALITGASEGIGLACAQAFRARGVRLALLARSEDKLRQAAGPGDLVLAYDLTRPESRTEAIARTIAHFGRLDILVNNAGAGIYVPAHRSDTGDVRTMFELNLFAPLELARMAAVQMRKQGEGSIVNVSSIAGLVTLPWFTTYSASKAALSALSDGLRMELDGSGIQVLLVCPGYVKTAFQQNVLAGNPPALHGLRARWAITPEECAKRIANGIENGSRMVVTPRTGWALVWLERFFPALVHNRLTKIYREQENQA